MGALPPHTLQPNGRSRAEHGAAGDAAAPPWRRRGGTPASSAHRRPPTPTDRQQQQEEQEDIGARRGAVGAGGRGGARVLRLREPARPGGGGAADRGGVRVRGPGVPAAHGGDGTAWWASSATSWAPSAPTSASSSTTSPATTPSGTGASTWGLDAEWKGRPFPFSRGCSFYRCQPDPRRPEQVQIVYGRDCVEPATKPGELALVNKNCCFRV